MSIYVPTRAQKAEVKAGPIGPGSGPLLTEFPLDRYSNARSPQKRMHRAWTLSFEVPWIAAAEDAIVERFAGVDWHLEDENDETIDDQHPNQDSRDALALMEKPAFNLPVGAPYYRSDLWALTCRAMGVCGSAFILQDSPELLAGTPNAMLPIGPWRMTAVDDQNGNLIGWLIDRTQGSPGIGVRIDQIMHYQLRRNFEGHFGIGLIESALLKAQLSQGLDQHLGLVLSAGGRLSGLLSPKSGVMDPETMLQMERDWRTVVEQSDAAKRLQLVRAPVDFQKTTLTPQEMQIRSLMDGARDDLLGLWGVPLSIIGGTTPAGLNSGDTRKYDEAAIWQGPVHHRLNIFREVTQYQLLDRWQALGATVELEIEEPEFDDDSPRYDLLGKSLNSPLTNRERRGLIGLPPTGDPAIDDAILLPVTIVPYAVAPPEGQTAAPSSSAAILGRAPQEVTSDPAMLAAGETTKAKLHPRIAPLHASLLRLRQNIADKTTPRLKTSVHNVLEDQRRDIASRLRTHADAVKRTPRDSSIWFARGWDAKLAAALRPHLELMASTVNAQIVDVLPSRKAAPLGAVERVLHRGAARVTGINETTREKVQLALIRGLDAGYTALDVADLIEGIGTDTTASAIGLDMGTLFDEYRAEMVARTELMDAYNGAALGSYSDAGIEMVEASDGDGDPECAARDGQLFSVDDADAIEDHPNGTLDWIPVIDYDEAISSGFAALEGKAAPLEMRQPEPTPINVHFHAAAVTTNIAQADHPVQVNPTPVTVLSPDHPISVTSDHPVTVHVAPSPAPNVVVTQPVTVNVPEAPAPVVMMPDIKPRKVNVIRDSRTGQITGTQED